MTQEHQTNELGQVVANGVRLLGDTLIAPGTSQILDGKIGKGFARVAVGMAARAILGPIGWLAVGLDSYTKTTTGRGILERVTNRVPATVAAPAPAPAQPAAAQPVAAQPAAVIIPVVPAP